jgi:3-phosphoshikimate 1-carboxyvinyltransferase
VQNYSAAQDTLSTLEAVRSLGGEVVSQQGLLFIRGKRGRIRQEARIDCSNSGTTMRLLMGVLSGVSGEYTLDGDASLRRRPMERVAKPLREMGASIECTEGRAPVSLRGGALVGIEYKLPVPSAQLKSAILLAGIQAEGATIVVEAIRSRDHTERLLKLCGVRITAANEGWRVDRSTPVLPEFFSIPGDISSAAFFLCAGVIIPGSELVAEGVLLNETRTGFLDVLRRMGASLEVIQQGDRPEPWGSIRVRFSPTLSGCEIHAHEVPYLVDEVPVLALTATQAQGKTVFHDVGELRVKESDRLEAVATQLTAMGARILTQGDKLIVEGPTALEAPPELRSFGDHRIAMTLRLGCILAETNSKIDGEESTAISYPGFHETLKGLLR